MFDNSFAMCIFTAIVLTEWYQAADINELLEYRVKDAHANLVWDLWGFGLMV